MSAARYARREQKPVRSGAAAVSESELTDRQWNAVTSFLRRDDGAGRHRSTDLRRIVAAINHYWRSGCSWRTLPPEFPPWPTVYTYYRSWSNDGTLRKLRIALNPPSEKVKPRRRRNERPPVKLDPDENRSHRG